MYKGISEFLARRKTEFSQIDGKRKELLEGVSQYVRAQRAANEPVCLIFVCTHNSRRSHMAQLWAEAAAAEYGLDILTYSGGTATTAFDPRAVEAMQRAGFRLEKTTAGANPAYHARLSDDRPATTCFSKTYDSAPNPKRGFAAIMVCNEADNACPAVPGAAARFAIPYIDPKLSDGTPQEAATYDERGAEIARELLYIMSRIAN